MKWLRVFAIGTAGAALAFTGLAGPESLKDFKEGPKVETTPGPSERNWQGVYVGINAGYAFDLDEDVSDLDSLNIGPPVGSFSFNADGPVAGGQVGFNLQPLHWLVLGIEGDAGYLGVDGRARQPGSPDGGTFAEVDPGVYATARGRVGVAFDRVLIYATGGWFGTNYEQRIIDDEVCTCGFPLGGGSNRDFRSGWTVGGGVEWMFRRHWTLRVEYLYFDVSDGAVVAHIRQTGDFAFGFADNTGNIVRAGLNYKF